MSASTATCAPATGWLAESNSRKVTTAGPMRVGSGEISCSIVIVRDESAGLEHAVMSSVAAQQHNRR